MTDTHLVIQTLGFATGAILFGLLIALARKAERLAARKSFGPESAALGLWWNAGKLIQYVGLIAGLNETSMPLRAANAAAYSALAVLPTTLLLANLTRCEPRRGERLWRALPFISAVPATALVAGFAASVFTMPDALSRLMEFTAYNLMLHLAAIAFLFRGAKRTTPARVELFLLTGLATMLLILIHLASGESWAKALIILAQQSSIPIALTSFASLSRFRFADVFIKRSFVILAAVIIAMLYSLLAVEPVVSAIRASAGFPFAASLIATTAMWVAMLLLFPSIRLFIIRATDKLLFRRPDYRRLARAFARESEKIEDETQLFALIERYARSALNVERARALDSKLQLSEGESLSDIRYLEPDDPLSDSLGEPRIEMLIPVRVNGEAKYHVALSAGRTGRNLLSEELAFLSAIAESAGRALELLEFERERRERQLRESSLKRLLSEAELRALRAQINPHFLFNTLNTIADLITSEPEKAEAMTEQLAEVFRCVLARTDRDSVRVSEEIDFLRTYLAIEQTRFGDRLRVSIEVDPEIAGALIPPFILQPIVENAIRHGLSPRPEGGAIRIIALNDADNLRLVVEDDGAGWRSFHTSEENISIRSSGGVGLRNVSERLRTAYGEKASLKIGSMGKGVAVTITISKDETESFNQRRRSVGPVSIA
ncbi:MAG: sensor histidine kinase [Acidobacteriota bacterium]